MSKRSLVATLLVFLSANLSAHDFWLAANRAADGITVKGHVGEKFPVPDSKTTPDRVDLWRVIGSRGDVTPARNFFQDGDSLATRIVPESPGTYLGVMTIVAREIEMTGKEFTDYLREEGLDRVIEERARRSQSDQPARERYARYAKVVFRTGEGSGAHVTRPADLKAELVPSVNPASLAPGAPLSVRLLVEGQPVAGALIAAVSHNAKLEERTGADGRATFTVPSKGPWLLKTVHMARPARPGEPAADWESYWVTLAFEIE